MRQLGLLISTSIFAILLTTSCKKDAPEVIKDTLPKQTFVSAPDFNADSTYSYIQKQVAFGPRVPMSAAHKSCKNWLLSKFKDLKCEVSTQEFTATGRDNISFTGTNIIAKLNPASTYRVMLSAHWDTRWVADHDPSDANHSKPVDGADDGGSGVAVLIEIARIIAADTSFKMGIDIVLFDVEDQGTSSGSEFTWCLGSQAWAKENVSMANKPRFGVLLDMVGARGAIFPKEGYSTKYASHVVNKVWAEANRLGYNSRFVNVDFPGIIDDHKYVNEIANIPMIDIIHVGSTPDKTFGSHWHTLNDNIDVIDKVTLKAVGQTVLSVLYQENESVKNR